MKDIICGCGHEAHFHRAGECEHTSENSKGGVELDCVCHLSEGDILRFALEEARNVIGAIHCQYQPSWEYGIFTSIEVRYLRMATAWLEKYGGLE